MLLLHRTSITILRAESVGCSGGARLGRCFWAADAAPAADAEVDEEQQRCAGKRVRVYTLPVPARRILIAVQLSGLTVRQRGGGSEKRIQHGAKIAVVVRPSREETRRRRDLIVLGLACLLLRCVCYV